MKRSGIKPNPDKTRDWQRRSALKAADNAAQRARNRLAATQTDNVPLSGLKPSQRPLKRTRIKPVSDKQQAENNQYRKRAPIFLAEHPNCQREGCRNEATQVHHRRGREGKNMLDESAWMAVCFPCHEFIETRDFDALSNGHKISRHTGDAKRDLNSDYRDGFPDNE